MEKKVKLLDVEKAEKIILRKVKPLKGKEKIDIKDSFGRVLISNLNSKRNQPELDLSAMDGYAVRKRDLSSLPKKFELVGEIKAGDTWRNPPLQPHQLVCMERGSSITEVSTADSVEDNYRVFPGDSQSDKPEPTPEPLPT